VKNPWPSSGNGLVGERCREAVLELGEIGLFLQQYRHLMPRCLLSWDERPYEALEITVES